MIRTWVRTIGIGLILLPEPVSTAVGIGVFCASFAIPKEDTLKKFNNLDTLAKRSIQTPEPVTGFRRYLLPEPTQVKHARKDPKLEMQKLAVEKSEIIAVNPHFQAWYESHKETEQVTYHPLKNRDRQPARSKSEPLPDIAKSERQNKPVKLPKEQAVLPAAGSKTAFNHDKHYPMANPALALYPKFKNLT